MPYKLVKAARTRHTELQNYINVVALFLDSQKTASIRPEPLCLALPVGCLEYRPRTAETGSSFPWRVES
jgi:hypothetical protein